MVEEIIPGLIWTMWLDIWGSSEIAAVVLLAVFAALSWRKGYNIMEGSTVVLPVLFGIVLDGTLPRWIEGVVLVAVGCVWGLFILRITGLRM